MDDAAGATGLRHDAVVFDSSDGDPAAAMLAATTPFLAEGLDAGDLVLLACSPERAAQLTAPLGERAAALEHDPRIALLGTRAPDAFSATRKALDRAVAQAAGRVRIVGEVDFATAPGGPREALRYEIAVNEVLADEPVSALCLIDAGRLSERLVAAAAAAHPRLVVDGVPVDNPDYREPVHFLRSLPAPRTPGGDLPLLLAVDDATVLAQLRARLRAAVFGRVPDGELQDDLLLAVSEIAANAFRHGGVPVSVRVWGDDSRLVCTITDTGRGFDNPLAGYVPAHGRDLGRGGMGLWLARKLWDSVDLLPAEQGLTVRLSTRIA